MAQPHPTHLTEYQHKQLKCWLWDADRTTLRYVLEKVCDMNSDVAALVYEQAPCKDYEVAEGETAFSGMLARKRPATVERELGPSASASSLGNDTVKASSPVERPGRSEEENFSAMNATAGSTTKPMSPSPATTLVPAEGNATASDQGKMSLATLLQPAPVPPGFTLPKTSVPNRMLPPLDSLISKKRKLNHSGPRRLVICKLCGCPYDVHEDEDQLCIFHPGYMDRDEEAWEDIDDYGSISDRDHQVNEPELYIWSCCGKNGEALGCSQGYHLKNGAQSTYAELKLRRGQDQGTDTEASDS